MKRRRSYRAPRGTSSVIDSPCAVIVLLATPAVAFVGLCHLIAGFI